MNQIADCISVTGSAWPSSQQPGVEISSQTCIAKAQSSMPFDVLAEDQVRISISYLEAARKRAVIERLEDGTWYAEVAELPGVWADGPDPFACLGSLMEVVEDWIVLKLRDGDSDFPVLDDIDLNQR